MAKRKVAGKRKQKETYPDFPAAITERNIDAIEKAAQSFGVNRRMLLITLARGREELIKGAGDQKPEEIGEIICDLLGMAKEYNKHLDAMKDMVKRASARLIAAGETMVNRGLVK